MIMYISMGMWPQQMVDVNGVFVPTSEFVKNREKYEAMIAEKQWKNPVPSVLNEQISNVEDADLNIVPLEEKNEQVEEVKDEIKYEDMKRADVIEAYREKTWKVGNAMKTADMVAELNAL